MICKCGWPIYSSIYTTIICPGCKHKVDVCPTTTATTTPPQKIWEVIHSYPFKVWKWVPEEAKKFFLEWLETVPQYGCKCREDFQQTLSKYNLDNFIGSRLNFFSFTAHLHNLINKKLEKPHLSFHAARKLYDPRYTIEQPEKVKAVSSRAIVCIAVGDHSPKQTHQNRLEYARKVGAQLIELTDDRWPAYPMYNKWRVYNIAKMFDKTLYLDSDVVISPTAPNIFEETDKLALVNELPWVDQPTYFYQLKKWAERLALPVPDWCPNAGVLLIPREQAGYYRAPEVVPDNEWCLDQYLLAFTPKEEVHFLDKKWNLCWMDGEFWGKVKEAHFVHLNGTSGETRTKLIDKVLRRDFAVSKPKPKLGFLSLQYMEVGGTETWHETMIPALAEHFEITGMAAVTNAKGDPSRFPCHQEFGEEGARKIASQSDVVIAWGLYNLAEMLPEPRPKIIHIHHGDVNSTWSNDVVKSQPNIFDCIVGINEEVCKEIKSLFPHKHVAYMQNAVNPKRIGPTELWPRYSKPTVLWSARMEPDKRVDWAIEIARLLPDHLFILLGGGTEWPHHRPSNVMLEGIQANQANYLAIADCFLSTAREEGFGLSMGEAMLAEVPVVATPFGLGVVPDIVMQGTSPQSLAEAIKEVTRTKPVELIVRAKEFIETYHSIPLVTRKWVNLINHVHYEVHSPV